MPLSPLQPVIDERVCVRGDVTIHPSAAIATGVILQADPNSRIEIAAGACLGMGVIVHSSNGPLTIGAGANLGAGVLAIGKCSIGENACIGAATTLFNASVDPQQIVAPGSLLGDWGRQVDPQDSQPVTPDPPEETHTVPSQPIEPKSHTPTSQTEAVESESHKDRESQPSSNGFKPQSSSTEIYGQVHVRRIFTSLFPNSPSVNSQPPEDSSGKSN